MTADGINYTRRNAWGEYIKKARELKDLQVELAMRIELHQKGVDGLRSTLENLISSAYRAEVLFERSKTEQKRELITVTISNLRLRDKRLESTLRSSFDAVIARPYARSWDRPSTFRLSHDEGKPLADE